MKRIKISALLLALAVSGSAVSAAVPAGGVYLNKDGTPVAAEEEQPPRLVSNPMPAMSAAVQHAMALLPRSGVSSVQFTVDEYGQPKDASIAESSGSVVLDEYAVCAVQGWKFKAARRGDRQVSASVRVPVRFTSMMVSVPAEASSQPMEKMPDRVRTLLSSHPGGFDVPVLAHIGSDGKQESAPEPADWANDAISSEEKSALQKYAADCVKSWPFTPAQNPDGEAIRSDPVLTVSVR